MSAGRRGFTLIEVLIALAVIALALLGLTRVAALQVRDFDALRERTLAVWVASNVLAETRLAATLPAQRWACRARVAQVAVDARRQRDAGSCDSARGCARVRG